jgi:hypothetical protein
LFSDTEDAFLKAEYVICRGRLVSEVDDTIQRGRGCHSPEEVIISLSDVIICCTEDVTSLVEVVIRAEEDGAEDVHV